MAGVSHLHLIVHCTTTIYLVVAMHEGKMRTQMTTLGRLGSVFATFGAVIDVARAVEARRMPDTRDLKTLGIDQSSFQRIYFR
jgi:hypothetical protein